jgi:hypothetical protein
VLALVLEVVGHELGGEGDEGNHHQEHDVDEQHGAIDAVHAGDALVVVDPDDADCQEAGGVGQVRGPEVDQGPAKVLVGAGADADLEHQQRGRDRKHAVRKRLHARGAAVLHAAIFAAASDADGL